MIDCISSNDKNLWFAFILFLKIILIIFEVNKNYTFFKVQIFFVIKMATNNFIVAQISTNK